MKHVKLFESFLNEIRPSLNAPTTGSNMSSMQLGDLIGKKVFKYEKGQYSNDTIYCYGDTINWVDGTSEKGYTIEDYTLKMRGPWMLFKSFDFNPAAIKQMNTLLKPGSMDAPSRCSSFDCADLSVKRAKGISSKKIEPMRAVIWAGNYVGATDLLYSGISYKDNQNIEEWADVLKKDLNEKAKNITGERLVKKLFEEIITSSSMMRTRTLHQSQSSMDIGIGIAASTKVNHKIYKEYDFTEYVKAYGIESLKAAIDANSFFKSRTFKGITPEGIMSTDESWTDTYD